MRTFTGLVLILLISSCSSTNKKVTKLSACDSVAINFNVPQSNNIEKSVNSIEKTAIKKLAAFVGGKSAPEYKCGYDGNILFYEKSVMLADVSFKFSVDSCRHFIALENGELKSSVMSNEAANFLRSLYEGKNWY